MFLQCGNTLVAPYIPHPHTSVVTTRRQQTPVRRERQASHRPTVTSQVSWAAQQEFTRVQKFSKIFSSIHQLLLTKDIPGGSGPEFDGSVAGPARQEVARRAVRAGVDVKLVRANWRRGYFFLLVHVPEAECLVAAARAEGLVLGRPRAVVDVALVAQELAVQLQTYGRHLSRFELTSAE